MILFKHTLLPLYLVLGVGLSYYAMPEPQKEWKKFTSQYLNSPQILNNESVVLINTDDSQSRILYTLDGRDPSLYGRDYSTGIDLNLEYEDRSLYRKQFSAEFFGPKTWAFPYEGTVVRACSNQGRLGCSKVKNFIVFDKFTKTDLNIISLSLDESFWFDEYNGKSMLGKSYENAKKTANPWWAWDANFRDDGESSEDYAGFEFIDGSTGQRIFDTNVLLKLHGNASRAFAQKSLRVSDDEYRGSKRLVLPVFNDRVSFNSFNLRNSGNDWGNTMFADVFMHQIAGRLGLDVQRSEPVHVLINGHYWGVLNLRERFDKTYFKEKYSVDDLALIELDTKLDEGKDKDFRDYKSLLNRLKQLNTDAAYKLLDKEIDIDNFINYIIVETFFANSDWPKNNVKTYRLGKKDKWKWMIYDMDYGLSYVENAANKNMFEHLNESEAYTAQLFKFALGLPKFKEQFKRVAHELLKTELTASRLQSTYDEITKLYENAIEYQIARWQKPYSVTSWNINVKDNRDFLQKRVEVYSSHLKDL